MKRLFLALLICLLFASQAFAATATVTNTNYGYEVTGGTDATLVISGYAFIQGIVLYPGGAATDTASFTSQSVSGSSDVSCLNLNQYCPFVSWAFPGVQFTNLKVTLTSSSDIVYIYVNRVKN